MLSVRFRRIAETTASIPHKAIIDTGADMTIAPADVLIALQAQELQETNLISQWGDEHPVILYIVDLELDDQVLPGVLVAGDETATEVILGRNVLIYSQFFSMAHSVRPTSLVMRKPVVCENKELAGDLFDSAQAPCYT